MKQNVLLTLIVIVCIAVAVMLAGCGGGKQATGADGENAGLEAESSEYRHDGVLYKTWLEEDKWADGQRGEIETVYIGLLDVINEGTAPIKVAFTVRCQEEDDKLPVFFITSLMAGPNDLTSSPDAIGCNRPLLLPVPPEGLPVQDLLLPGHSIASFYPTGIQAKSWEQHETSMLPNSVESRYVTRDVVVNPSGQSLYYVQIPRDAKAGETYSFRLTIESQEPRWEHTFPYAFKIYMR